MDPLLDRLLDLDRLSTQSDGVRFAFEHAIPLYLWFGVIGACAVFAWAVYRRSTGPAWFRVVLGGLRTLILVLLAALVAGPILEKRFEATEPDWLIVLLDRSESMTVKDIRTADGARSREEQLGAAVDAARAALAESDEPREIHWFGFGGDSFELPASEDGAPRLDPPVSRRTAIGTALESALDRASARPVAGVLVVSDGRTVDAPDTPTLRALQAAGAPVHVVPLGSPGTVTDIAVRSVSSPRVAYRDDPVPVVVDLAVLGDPAGLGGELRLIDEATDGVLESQRVDLSGGDTSFTLSTRTLEPGDHAWRVEFVSDAPDLIDSNNRGTVELNIVDRPLRVLYIDGYPRWEQRYLRNLLIRESTVESSNLMLAANRRYLQEGDTGVTSFPSSPGEWSRYDVVVLGDVDPGVLSDEQIELIRLFVAEQGGGIVWIGGESYTPRAWWSTPLAALIPFSRPAAGVGVIGEPVQVRPTADAARLGVLRLDDTTETGWPSELVDPIVGWSPLHWAQRVDAGMLKPTAQVLASAGPIAGDPRWPLVMTMRYGAGRAVYIASDEIWRWRYGRGEILYERFWIQLIRLLGRERLSRGDAGFSIEASGDSVAVGDPVAVTLEIQDQSLLETIPDVLRVRASAVNPEVGVQSEIEFQLGRDRTHRGRYTGVWTPPAAGSWTVTAIDPELGYAPEGSGRVTIQATVPGYELADPRPDHDVLRAMADQTGGTVFTPARLEELGAPGVFPSRSVRRVLVEREPLWDTPLVLTLLVMLAGFEWIGRRVLRLM